MSKREIIQCEICTAMHDTRYVLPDSWITLKEGSNGDEQHFCSDTCLNIWLQHRLSGTSVAVPQDKPACKARRFLLVDEQANITEGTKYGNGTVSLENSRWFETWDKFKAAHDGSGVQWVDQEVSE